MYRSITIPRRFRPELKKSGTDYGGFFYPSALNGLDKDSIIYCVGAGEDISHDIEIAKQLNSNVHIFDPSPRAVAHVKYVKEVFAGLKEPLCDKTLGGGDTNYLTNLLANKIDPAKIKLHEYGLFTEDKLIKFYAPLDNEHVSHSVVEGMKSSNYIEVEVKTITTIMKELSHTSIGLLKVDIEGCECDVIDQMLSENVHPRYVSIDFDLGERGEVGRCIKTIKRLNNSGYRIMHQDGPDFSFAYVK